MNTPDAPDPRKVAEAALEAFVYVPLGLALEAKDLVPKLAQRGRNQVVLARLGARFALQRAEVEAERLVKRFQPAPPTEAATTPEPPTAPPAPAPPTTTNRASAPTDTTATAKPSRKVPATAAATGGAPAERDTLAIPGYDTLSASQVVPRLDALRPDELEAVRAHEATHRNRRTILSRIAQLQA